MQVYNDEMYHYGIIGMKWGKRKNRQVKESASARNQMRKDQFKHPIHSTAAQLSLIKKHPLKALAASTETVKALNADVKNRVESKKSTKERRDAGAKAVGGALEFIGNNMLVANRNHQAMNVSKMIFPD